MVLCMKYKQAGGGSKNEDRREKSQRKKEEILICTDKNELLRMKFLQVLAHELNKK